MHAHAVALVTVVVQQDAVEGMPGRGFYRVAQDREQRCERRRLQAQAGIGVGYVAIPGTQPGLQVLLAVDDDGFFALVGFGQQACEDFGIGPG